MSYYSKWHYDEANGSKNCSTLIIIKNQNHLLYVRNSVQYN